MPFPKPRNRSRRSSQSSNLSRDNSIDRSGGSSNATFQRSYRSHSGNRYNSSRDNSAEGRPYRSSTNWRSLPRAEPNLDSEIAEMSRKFNESVEISKAPPAAGMLLLPSSTELVKKVISDQQLDSTKQLMNGGGGGDNNVAVARQLFDPRNPDKPILVSSVNQRLKLDFHHQQKVNSSHVVHDERDKRKKRSNRCSQSLENPSSQPIWYDQTSNEYKRAHNPKLIEQIVRIDHELHKIVMSSELFRVNIAHIVFNFLVFFVSLLIAILCYSSHHSLFLGFGLSLI